MHVPSLRNNGDQLAWAVPMIVIYHHRHPGGMGDESMTYTQQGMVYGMLFGTVVAILLYSLTNDVVYFAFMGLPWPSACA